MPPCLQEKEKENENRGQCEYLGSPLDFGIFQTELHSNQEWLLFVASLVNAVGYAQDVFQNGKGK